jgi:hypothetical protein
VSNKDREAIYVANTTGFVALPGGEEFFFRQGVTKVRADHPVMRACPKYFEPLDASDGVIDYAKKP